MKYLFIGIIGALMVIHLLILMNLRYEAWPEMLLIPYLQLNDFKLYSDMVYHYNPGLAWVGKTWFGIFGVSPDALEKLTWLIILVNDAMVGIIANKRWGKVAGLVAVFSLVILQPIFDGNGLWYELAMTPWLLLAFWTNNPIFMAVSFVFKQSTFWFFPLFIKKWKQTIALIATTFAGLSFWFWSQGSLSGFWFWPYKFIFTIFPLMPGYKDYASWRQWILPLGVLILILGCRILQQKTLRFLFDPRDPASWALAGIPLMFPRFGLFHFQPTIVFLSLNLAVTLNQWSKRQFFRGGQILTLLSLLIIAGGFWYRALKFNWGKSDRFLEPGIYQVAARVALETDENEPVFLLNGPEQVYVLANRLPPKPWLTQFSWFLDLPGFQQKLIDGFQVQNLRQVFITPYKNEGEFVPGSYQPRLLVKYLEQIGMKELTLDE